MDYVERIAREIHSARSSMGVPFDGLSAARKGSLLRQARCVLAAIAATGCKVVERDMTENQYTQINWRLGLMREECEGVVSDVIDSAPAYPGADDEPR